MFGSEMRSRSLVKVKVTGKNNGSDCKKRSNKVMVKSNGKGRKERSRVWGQR